VANLTSDSILNTIGSGAGPFAFDLPVKAATAVFLGSLCTQLAASGMVVPYSTALTGVVVGVAQHGADNTAADAADGDKRVRVETRRMFAFANGAGDDAFADTDLIGSLVYGTDDNTAAKTSNSQARKAVGFFFGLETDGTVRVFVDPALAKIVDVLQTLTATPADATALRDNLVASFG
jgi:hypothetical protein